MTAGTEVLLPRWVVPVCPEGVVLEDHAVLVENGCIAAVSPAGELVEAHPDATVTRLPDHALMPGLVNIHTHSAMALMRGLADDLPLMRWLEQHIWPTEQRWVGAEYVRVGTDLAMAEMLAGGTTCFNDNYFFPDVTAAAADRAGMRASIGIPIISVPTAWAQTEDEYFRRGLDMHQQLLEMPLVSSAFAPHAPYTVTDDAFHRIRSLAEEMEIPVHLHLLETAGEIQGSLDQYGLSPLDRMDSLGLLTDRLLAVHMTQLDDTDIARLARSGVHVLHCPASNLKLASGICRVADLDAAGVNVAIGTDGAASNNTLDMFAETRLAALLAKGASGDPEAVPAERALSMATINGARALGQEDRIGSIEVGKRADMAAVDLSAMATAPVHHVISHLVYAASRSQVSDVWIDGRRVVERGELTTLDAERTAREAAQWGRRLFESDQGGTRAVKS
ncbi:MULTISPECIES: TRZ/ATZ family hydrolase [unclassified Wenzhouxiangella]|uniref:TRZ/ATZ family hydrolase n=1 Tax=unclassified Wenzhouxiangella TaxID=2613841 RepID=UPI000E328938|nr:MULTISPECIES: TRZ/ATZ family hydrolase [unclassified Wenzhouxiangella]RFF28350.1 TRZ/ATZ family hydrolase [Wenzhouxiangella sp. 15181]RFP68049.1 TRZ/ATZ family hydrolase [Wenzhouxiangella sp. 15190]